CLRKNGLGRKSRRVAFRQVLAQACLLQWTKRGCWCLEEFKTKTSTRRTWRVSSLMTCNASLVHFAHISPGIYFKWTPESGSKLQLNQKLRRKSQRSKKRLQQMFLKVQ